ncbi:MAG: response regulator [Campylobacterales bacterium]|nr:response regulator [Campylobacterales bacterium]
MVREHIRKAAAWAGGTNRSIRSSLIVWFFLLAIFPFVSVSWYTYEKTIQNVEQMQRVKLEDSSVQQVEGLLKRFYETHRDIQGWSKFKETKALFSALHREHKNSGLSLKTYVQSPAYAALTAQHTDLLEVAKKHFAHIHDIFLIDLEGNILYTVAKESDLGTNLISGDYAATRFAAAFRKTREDEGAYFSDMEHYAPSAGAITGFITQPLYDASTTMIGVIGLKLDMDILLSSTETKQKSSISHYLVGEDGLLRTMINDPQELLSRRISSTLFHNWQKNHALPPSASQERLNMAICYQGPDARMVMGHAESVDLLGVKWVHISEIDEEDLMAVPRTLAFLISGLSLLIVILVMGMAILISGRITRPIAALSEASHRYMRGEKDIRVAILSENEIGEFAMVFNRLIQAQEENERALSSLAHEAKEALSSLEEQKHALDAHSIVTITNVKGTITYVNQKFEEISGYSEAELLGANHHIIESGFHPKAFWTNMYHTISQGETWHAEVCNKAKNGRLYWVDTSIVPFLNGEGKPVKYIAIRTDITARKNAEMLISEKEGTLQTLLNSVAEGIYGIDTHGNCTFVNRSFLRMLGFENEEEVLGKHIHSLIHHSHEDGSPYPASKCKMYKANITHAPSHADDEVFWRRDGSSVAVEYWSYPMMREGAFVGAVATFLDISERKKAQMEILAAKDIAESSARAKSEFLATMSHEIRTPMNGVLGMLGLLSYSQLDETQRHQLNLASGSANSLLGLINDILDFSKVEAGKMELEMIEFNLREELGDFAEAISFKAQDKGLELILDTTQLKRQNVITDPGRLRQILTNLVDNAVKFTHRGEIVIRVRLEESDEGHGELFIEVRDTGIGIPADKIDTLFESFTQADTSTTRKYGGTGLGLAIAKQLCVLMGGSIHATSTQYEGSTFHMKIRVGLSNKPALTLPDVSVKGRSVLVVDDNDTNRAVVRAQLELWGMEVYEAEDPLIAFDYCRIRISQGHTPPYDIALLDMQMPNIDGAELGREIREITACNDMKLVMMTSLGSRNDAKRFARMGFNAFFAKPTTTNDLFKALRVLLDNAEALEGAGEIVTKDYISTLDETSEAVEWPSNTRLLLVEDNPTNQMVAQGMLEMIGLKADIANDGSEALESLKFGLETVPYTLVLMDCQMPNMDGYEASTAIREGRAGEANKNIPIIAMTANAMSGDREKCLLSGMNDYVSKPINLNVLKTALLTWLLGQNPGQTLRDTVRVTPPKKSDTIWDRAEALGRMGGKESLLMKILDSFVGESEKMVGELTAAMDKGDLSAVCLHAHSLKGSAGNISAHKLQALAKEMEFAAKNGQNNECTQLLTPLKEALGELLTHLSTTNAQQPSQSKRKKCLDSLQIAIALEELKKQLIAGSFIDTEHMKLFTGCADEAFNEKMLVLRLHIERFETAKALAMIENLISGLD